jgi:hypothetical protein
VSGFSRIVLEHTIRLAAEAIPDQRDDRVSSCIDTIRQYLSCMNDEESSAGHYYSDLQTVLLNFARHCDVARNSKPFYINHNFLGGEQPTWAV